MDRWLTPDTSGGGFICRRLLIPAGLDWLALVSGCLNELAKSYNFEAFGTATPDDTAAAFATMCDEFSLPGYDRTCRMIGEIVPYAGNTSPNSDWLVCDGASYLRSAYPGLFAVIGTAYGAADGNHFNVPDLRGRVGIGAGQGAGLSMRVLGDSLGEEAHVLTTGELAAHSHTDTGHAHTEGTATATAIAIGPGAPTPSAIPSAGMTGTASASISTTGNSDAHNNMPPSLAINYLIVAA